MMPFAAIISASFYTKQVSFMDLVGNREDLIPPSGIAGRAKRAHLNLIENAVPFAIIGVSTLILNVSTPLAIWGFGIFVASRIIHYFSYVAGITIIRSIVFHTGTIGLILITSQILASQH